jgi:hypothetical protein
MAQVIQAYCDVAFAYAAQIPGVDAGGRLARYLKVPRNALKTRLHVLGIFLPPLHAVLSHGDMSTFDFSYPRNNGPSRAAIYGNLATAAAEMFPSVRGYLAGLQVIRPGTAGGPPPGECPFVCTPLCTAHRSLSTRRL